MSWTDERVELLKKLWADGLSASQIASQLGGVTRNAVIGKVHRLNLSGRAKPASSAPRPRKVRAASPHRPSSRGLCLRQHGAEGPCPSRRRAARRCRCRSRTWWCRSASTCRCSRLNDQMCKWPIGDPGRRGLPLLRPPQLQQPALLRISLAARLPAGQRPPARARAGAERLLTVLETSVGVFRLEAGRDRA